VSTMYTQKVPIRLRRAGLGSTAPAESSPARSSPSTHPTDASAHLKSVDALEPLLSIDVLARVLSVSRPTIERMRAGGKLPRPDPHDHQAGPRRLRRDVRAGQPARGLRAERSQPLRGPRDDRKRCRPYGADSSCPLCRPRRHRGRGREGGAIMTTKYDGWVFA